MLLYCMAQLIIAQSECLRSLALIPPMLAQRMLENRLFMGIDSSLQIVDLIQLKSIIDHLRSRLVPAGSCRRRHWGGLPWAVEWIENDMPDWI